MQYFSENTIRIKNYSKKRCKCQYRQRADIERYRKDVTLINR